MMKRATRALAVLTFLLLLLLPFRAEAKKEPGAAGGSPAEVLDGGIPVLSLTIDPEEFQKVIDSTRHEYRAESGSVRIDLPEGWTCGYGEPDIETLGRELPLRYIRGRGNSTWLEEKKPFRFRLAESADLLAMGANEHWVLLANAKDDSLLRNRLAAYAGDALGLACTPKFVPVDLMVNGEYQGSYLLGEQVRIGENRIEIDKIKKSQTGLPEISGGYLISMSPTIKDADTGKFTLKSGLSFLVEEPELDEYDASQQEALQAQKGYIADYLQQVEDAVFGDGFRNADGTAVSDLMDLESAAEYWWVQTFSFNNDAFASTSTYLYKERNGKLYWGPLWDFDRSFWINGDDEDLNCGKMTWLDRLRESCPEYQQILRESWDRFDEILKEMEAEGGVLDRYKEEIRLSWAKDHELRWGELPEEGELDRIVEEIRQNIRLRREAIWRIIDTDLANVFADVTFTADGRTIAKEQVYRWNKIAPQQFPEPPAKDGYVFLGWTDESGQFFGADSRVFSDMTVSAEYRETETAPEPQPEPPEESSENAVKWLAAGILFLLTGGLALTAAGRRNSRRSG